MSSDGRAALLWSTRRSGTLPKRDQYGRTGWRDPDAVWWQLTLTHPGGLQRTDISDGVQIDASNVTLENCIITMPNSGSWDVGVSGGLTGVTIQNCEIYGTGLSGQVGDYGIYVEGNLQVMINACNIHDVGTGVIVSDGQTTVENCYIHNLNAGPNTHYNGIGFFGGSPADFSLNIQHNTIINQQAPDRCGDDPELFRQRQ